jgi:FkbM family methyltransferase
MQLLNCLEIGCHHTNTLADVECLQGAHITMVDPMQRYLDLAPQGDHITKLCYAVTADHTGTAPFYHITDDTRLRHALPEWCTTMGTLCEDHATVHHFGWQAHITCMQVPCIAMAELIDQHALHDVDFVQIDVEGMELALLTALHNHTLRPSVIKFESKLMSAQELDRMCDMWATQGYQHRSGMLKDYAGQSYNTILYRTADIDIEIFV